MSSPIPEHVCFIDLETLPGDATVGMNLTQAPGWEAPELEVAEAKPKKVPTSYSPARLAKWRKDKELRIEAAEAAAQQAAHDAIDDARARALTEWRKGSLSPYRGRIACIGVAFGEHPPEVIDCAEDEGAGLRELNAWLWRWQHLGHHCANWRGRTACKRVYVAHNGGGFDFPYLQLRALRHGSAKLAARFHQDKPWDGVLTDTMNWWPTVGGWGKRYDGKKLDDICAHLGIERPDNPIAGAEVLDAYVRGDWADVVAHARADVRDLREVYRVLLEVRGG